MPRDLRKFQAHLRLYSDAGYLQPKYGNRFERIETTTSVTLRSTGVRYFFSNKKISENARNTRYSGVRFTCNQNINGNVIIFMNNSEKFTIIPRSTLNKNLDVININFKIRLYFYDF